MKIRVTIRDYEYQGLKEGSVHENVRLVNTGQNGCVTFAANGKNWYLTPPMYEIVNGDSESTGPIKSDGGSSSYYDLPVSEWLLYTLNERQKEGKCYIKTEEMISAFFGNDFSFGTLLKSLVRAWGIKIGAGKAGNDMKYETGKIRYYADKILEQHEEKK